MLDLVYRRNLGLTTNGGSGSKAILLNGALLLKHPYFP